MLQVTMTTREPWNLSLVSDEQLLQGLSGLLAGSARVEARVVAHLAEVEERRLHLKAATSSMFDYCLRRLGLSESEAFHRITAARLARRFPVILELLEARSIHLSALRFCAITSPATITDSFWPWPPVDPSTKWRALSPGLLRARMCSHGSESCPQRGAERLSLLLLRMSHPSSRYRSLADRPLLLLLLSRRSNGAKENRWISKLTGSRRRSRRR